MQTNNRNQSSIGRFYQESSDAFSGIRCPLIFEFCKKDELISINMGKEQVVDFQGGYTSDTL